VLPQPKFPASPARFIGRHIEIDSFRHALTEGISVGRTSSFAVLGDWGVGKSSLLLKFASICAEPSYGMLAVLVSVSTDLHNYLGLAESLLDKLSETLAATNSTGANLRLEVLNWKLKRVNIGGFELDREAPQFFLRSGSTLLRHALTDAWKRFLPQAHIQGVIFFLDDVHNLSGPHPQDVALALRDQFQALAIEGMNYSVCFSARTDYFSTVRSFAEPAVRFYDKIDLGSFSEDETTEYVRTVFGPRAQDAPRLARWLYEKTLGHPYFLAFISRQLALSAKDSPVGSPERLWRDISQQLEKDKFCSDLAHVAGRELELLCQLARTAEEECTPRELCGRFQRMHFTRLVEKGLLIRSGRGRYKLYHPLFNQFLQRLKP